MVSTCTEHTISRKPKPLFKEIRLFTNYATQCQGHHKDKQGQAVIKQGQTGTNRDKQGQTGTNRDKQGHSYSIPACPYLSLSVPVCLCLSLLVLICPCFSLFVLVCPCLSLYVPVCLYIGYTVMSTPAYENHEKLSDSHTTRHGDSWENLKQ